MDSQGLIRSLLTVDFSLPLQVDTNINYIINNEKFPGLEDSIQIGVPSLMVCPDNVTNQGLTYSLGLLPFSAENEPLPMEYPEDELYDLLDDLEFPPDHVVPNSDSFLESVMDSCVDKLPVLSPIDEMEHKTSRADLECLTPETTDYTCESMDDMPNFCRTYQTGVLRKRTRCKRRLSDISDDSDNIPVRCSKKRKFSSSLTFGLGDFTLHGESFVYTDFSTDSQSPSDVFGLGSLNSNKVRQC